MLRTFCRSSVLLAVLLLAAPAGAFGPPRPDALGTYGVGHTVFDAYDASRDRTLPVHVWYPVAPDTTGTLAIYQILFLGRESTVAIEDAPVARRGPFPLVVFSHGNGGVGIQSFFLCEMLASHGFVVAAPDHVGNTLVDVLLGTLGSGAESAQDRPLDVSFVIDRMLARSATAGDRFEHAVSRFRIAVAGHSFGAFTALAAAGGFDGKAAAALGVELPPDFVPIPPDRRVRAIVPIAPGASLLGDDELARVRVPTLLIGGARDGMAPIEPELSRSFARIGAPIAYRADLVGAGHYSFTNVCDMIEVAQAAGLPPELIDGVLAGAYEEGCAPDLLPIAEAHRLTNLLTVSFLRRHLAGDPRYAPYLIPARIEAREPALELTRRPPPIPWWLRMLLGRLFGLPG